MSMLPGAKERILSAVLKGAIKGTRDCAEDVITKSMNNIPLETGTLRRSGTVSQGGLPQGQEIFEQAERGKDMSREFALLNNLPETYVSWNTPYAMKQHEDLSLQHAQGGAKWAENAVNANKAKYIDHIGNCIGQAIGEVKL